MDAASEHYSRRYLLHCLFSAQCGQMPGGGLASAVLSKVFLVIRILQQPQQPLFQSSNNPVNVGKLLSTRAACKVLEVAVVHNIQLNPLRFQFLQVSIDSGGFIFTGAPTGGGTEGRRPSGPWFRKGFSAFLAK